MSSPRKQPQPQTQQLETSDPPPPPPPPPPPSLHNLPPNLSADSLETIPILSALLSRLTPPAPVHLSSSSPPAGGSAGSPSHREGALNIKDIPTATDEIKHRLQKARNAVKVFPDMWQSVESQESEIRELDERIRAQRGVLRTLGETGRELAEIDMGGVMRGVEG